MAGITLNNTGYGGTVNINLLLVTGYRLVSVNKFAIKRIPGKATPAIDTATFIVEPRHYRITALVTTAQKTTLMTLADEMDARCLLSDNEVTTVYVRPLNIEVDAKSGYDDYPWVASIDMIAENH